MSIVTGPFRQTRPRHRPDRRTRVLAGVLGAGVLLVNTSLLLSDRAPSLLERGFRAIFSRVRSRVDVGGRDSIPGIDRAPETDFIAHVGLWGVAVVLIGLALWQWRSLLMTAIGVALCSVALEVAQGSFSRTRTVQREDLVGNAVGVVIGSLFVACCFIAWTTVSLFLERRDARTRLASTT